MNQRDWAGVLPKEPLKEPTAVRPALAMTMELLIACFLSFSL